MPFLAALFVVFSSATFLFQLVNRQPSTLLEALGLLVNAGTFFAISYVLIDQRFGYRWVSVVSLSLAAFYVAHTWYFLARKVRDRGLLFGFIGLAAFFLAVTIPLVLTREWITMSWAIQAVVMLWIAGKLNSQFLKHVSYLLYAIVIGRFCFYDLQMQYVFHRTVDTDVTLGDYLRMMAQRLVMFGVPVASLVWGARLSARSAGAEIGPVDPDNDMPDWVGGRPAGTFGIVAAVVLLFAFLHLELNRTFLYLFPPLRWPGLTLLWIALCGLLLYTYRRTQRRFNLELFVACIFVLIVKLIIFDMPSWHFHRWMYDAAHPYSFVEASMRLLDFGVVILLLTMAVRLIGDEEKTRSFAAFSGFTALALLFAYLSLETNTVLADFVPGMRVGGISILWSLFAIGCLLPGIWKNIAPLRYIALALFTVVCVKVFFSDLATLDPIYRIVAFMILGVLVLSGSFIYLKYQDRFSTLEAPADDAAI
jgi:uncharacterized membrane protein